jgi:hypothetical protein
MPTDKPILLELFCAGLLARTTRAIYVHDALSQAFRERTGLELQPDSNYTAGDVERAIRILRASGPLEEIA